MWTLSKSGLRTTLSAICATGGLILLSAAFRELPVHAQAVAGSAPSTYKLPFGPNPYLPSEARSAVPGFLKPADFPSAEYCSHCHQSVHTAWRQSAHANSFRAPWYVKNVNELGTTKGVAYTRHCEGCHNPVALFTGALTENSPVPRPHDNDGVTCMVCHSIQKVDEVRGIGSYVMGQPSVLVDDQQRPVAGLPTDAEIMLHLGWHKNAVMRPLYRTPEVCGACHKAAIPKIVNDYKWLRTFSTYDEWQQSSWSTETPLSFYKKQAESTCQTCHMPAEPSTDKASRSGVAYSHRFLGADTAVAVQYGYTEQLRRLEAFLREDKLQIDIFGMTIERGGRSQFVAPLGVQPFTLLAGDVVRVDVVVRNKGIGHTLVPELRDFYESWLEFSAEDQTGREVYHSGARQKDNSVDPLARSYTLQIVSNQGASLQHHEVWKTYVKAYDATISPGKSDVVRYRFRVPDGATRLTLSAAVRYRRFRRSFTDWVFDDRPDAPDRFPTVTMAAGRFDLKVGENQPSPSPTLPPDLTTTLRWNNYGIGMLERQQTAVATQAFRQVVAVDPAYQPGYVNVAIAEYTSGNYTEAEKWLAQALAKDPKDPRALYYRGLCERWQNHYDQAIATLQPVADQYPRFRQIHQELGYLYMTVRKFSEAKTEYQRVLDIDPDDPVTHRWLGPVLAALGDSAGAQREAVLAAQTGNDTAAGWVAQRFWREHQVIASESMPAHTFTQTGLPDDADAKRLLNLQNPPSYIWIEHY